jgi:hypothetical protein
MSRSRSGRQRDVRKLDRLRKNHGHQFSGQKFGPASKCRQLNVAERRQVEEQLKQSGALS